MKNSLSENGVPWQKGNNFIIPRLKTSIIESVGKLYVATHDKRRFS